MAEELEQQLQAANALKTKGDMSGAIAAYTRIIEDTPGGEKAYYFRAALYHHTGQTKRAIEDFTKLIQKNGSNQIAFFNRGLMHKVMGELNGAIADFTEAIKLDRAFVLAYIERGEVYVQQGKPKQAISDFDEALKLSPDNPRAFAGRAKAEYQKGSRASITRAQRDIQAALDLISAQAQAKNNIVLTARIEKEIRDLYKQIIGQPPKA